MDFAIFGSCVIKKWSDFRSYFTLRSVIFRIFIYVLDDNVASELLFQNSGNSIANTAKILVLVTKTVTVGFFLFRLFYSKNSDNLYYSMIFNVLYLEK